MQQKMPMIIPNTSQIGFFYQDEKEFMSDLDKFAKGKSYKPELDYHKPYEEYYYDYAKRLIAYTTKYPTINGYKFEGYIDCYFATGWTSKDVDMKKDIILGVAHLGNVKITTLRPMKDEIILVYFDKEKTQEELEEASKRLNHVFPDNYVAILNGGERLKSIDGTTAEGIARSIQNLAREIK